MRCRQLPDALSVARVPASLVLIAVFDPHLGVRFWIAVCLIGVIVVSDIVDGRIARHYALDSMQGYVLDGWGDRAFHLAIYLILFDQGLFGIAAVWVLAFREISVYAVRASDPTWHTTQTRIERITHKSYAGILRLLLVVELFRATTPLGIPFSTYRLFVLAILGAWNLVSYMQLCQRFATSQRRITHG